MLYGYGDSAAQTLKTGLESALGEEVQLISASAKEKLKVEVILGMEDASTFEDKSTKVMMLLGFDEPRLDIVLKQFPTDVQRPIFCGLTERNIDWDLEYLLEHLQAEDAYFKEHGKPMPDDGET